ncbi:hypothetical protein APHAL10511_004214 [Amanita phalloides]|nr:hypothetical protein APHAL10511_004214 [Amanita phalloides]
MATPQVPLSASFPSFAAPLDHPTGDQTSFAMLHISGAFMDIVTSREAAPDQGGLLTGKDPATYNPNDPIRIWIIQIGLIIGMTSLLSLILKRLRQPKVISEVLGGILLGPTAFGRIPGFTEHIFPVDSQPYLSLTANIGLCLFLFLVGLEIDASVIRRNWRLSLSVALAGMILPFALGVGISYPLYHHFIDQSVKWTYFMLFTGVAFSITAFPVLCRILTELKLLDTTVGIVVLSAGVGNDIIGWTLLALSVALVNAGSGLTALYILLICVAWVFTVLFPIKWIFKWLAVWTGSIENGPTLFYMTAVLLFMFGSAFFTDVIGVHAIFGAFLAGIIVPREGGLAIIFTEKLEDVVSIIFLPLYFTLSGLSTNLGLLNDGITWAYTIAIMTLAFAGKFGGCFFAAKYMAGFSWTEAGAVGALMSCKGLVELIVLNVGLSAGILSQRVFSMFVLEALVLTCITTPLVTLTYPPHVRKRASTGSSADVESPRLPGKKALHDNQKRRFTVVLDKLEHLPSVMAITQLIRASPAMRTVIETSGPITKITTRQSTNSHSSNNTLSSLSSTVVQALRLIELSDRASAVMKSSVTDYVIHTDPVLSIFRKFGQLIDVSIVPALSIVTFDDMSHSVAEHASVHESDLIMIPWLPPQIASPDDFIDAVQHHQQHHQQPPPPHTPSVVKHNPFDLLFKMHSNVEKSASVVHSHFVRGVFMRSKTDVALYVDQSPPGVDVAVGSKQHIFLPFFGGPDDRLALEFVAQICENPMMTATVMRITKREATLSDSPKIGEMEAGNIMTVASALSTTFPDTVYGQHNTEVRMQSDTADNVAWAKYHQLKREQGLDSTAALSRVEFKEMRTPNPLRTALEEASKPSGLEGQEGADSYAKIRLQVKDGRDGKRKTAYCRRLLVVVGRSRRLAVEDHAGELKELMQEYGHVGAEVKKTIGDVGAAFVVAGCGTGLIDEELMNAAGAFSLDQLMELAGLSCAQALAKVYNKERYPRVLVCCGPGNQGGDGLVAARHLGMFGYRPIVYMPKPGSKEIYQRLKLQCDNMKIPTLPPSGESSSLSEALRSSDVVLDAIFGFSFKGPVRPPFDDALRLISASKLPIVSVDIPSGWDVEKGNVEGVGLEPNVLVSLTAPKLGVSAFKGRHFLGGRFVPRALEEKFQLNLPEYPEYEQIMELESGESTQKL